MGFVLHCQCKHRNPFGRHGVDKLSEVGGKRSVSLGTQCAFDQAVVALHPGRRTPGACHDAQLRVDCQRALDYRQHIGAHRIDREFCQRVVGLSARHIVERVVPHGKVRGANRQSRKTQADAGGLAKQVSHQGAALLRVHAVLNQPGRGVGDIGTKADDFLVTLERIHRNIEGQGRPVAREVLARLQRQKLGLVGQGDPGLNRRTDDHRLRLSGTTTAEQHHPDERWRQHPPLQTSYHHSPFAHH